MHALLALTLLLALSAAAATDVYNMASSLAAVEAQQSALVAGASTATNVCRGLRAHHLAHTMQTIRATVASVRQSIVQAIGGIVQGATASTLRRVSDMEALTQDISHSANTFIPTAAGAIKSELLSRATTQTAALGIINSNLQSLATTITNQINVAVSTSLSSRTAIRGNMITSTNSVQTAGISTVAYQNGVENNRGVTELSTQTAVVASVTTAYSAAISTGTASVGVATDSACASTVNFNGPVSVLPGATDFATWLAILWSLSFL